MRIYSETSLRDFKFWNEAEKFARLLTPDEFDELECMFEVEFPEGVSDMYINNLFWHDQDLVAGLLGYDNATEFRASRR